MRLMLSVKTTTNPAPELREMSVIVQGVSGSGTPLILELMVSEYWVLAMHMGSSFAPRGVRISSFRWAFRVKMTWLRP